MSRGTHPTILSAFFLCVILVLAWAPAAPAGTNPAGKWVGEVRTPDGDKAEIFLTLDQQGGDWQGTLEDPMLGGVTPLMSLNVTSTVVRFAFKPENAPFPMHFTGSYIAADDRLNGTFSLHGNSRFVKFRRVPGSEAVALPPGVEPPEPARIRHDYNFAVTGRLGWWASLHVVKDEAYKINSITKADMAFDAAAKWFVLDGFNVFVRAYRGGQGFTDEPLRLEPFEDIGLTSDSYLKLDGFEFGGMGYLGNVLMRNSNFNPYRSAGFGRTSWELTADGRGSEVLVLDQEPLQGTDWSLFFGLGTEYALNERMALEFEVLWRYFMTQDDTLWLDTDNQWSNTHAWGLSGGLTFGF
jgi:hypothetical protein